MSRTNTLKRGSVSPSRFVVAASKATRVPDASSDGLRAGWFAFGPPGAALTSRVVPALRSRRWMSATLSLSPSARLVASVAKATRVPSALMLASPLSLFPFAPDAPLARLTRSGAAGGEIANVDVRISIRVAVAEARRVGHERHARAVRVQVGPAGRLVAGRTGRAVRPAREERASLRDVAHVDLFVVPVSAANATRRPSALIEGVPGSISIAAPAGPSARLTSVTDPVTRSRTNTPWCTPSGSPSAGASETKAA